LYSARLLNRIASNPITQRIRFPAASASARCVVRCKPPIALCEREQLALGGPERRAAGKQRPPVIRDLFEHARELLGAQRDIDPPGYLARLRGGDRILADPTSCAAGPVEDGVQDRAQFVDAAGRGTVALGCTR
jgi:hypothetical protein